MTILTVTQEVAILDIATRENFVWTQNEQGSWYFTEYSLVKKLLTNMHILQNYYTSII